MITRNLPVKLTNDELLLIGKRLADQELEIVQVKDEKKESMAEFKQREEAVKNNITRLTRALHDGVEWRPVECIESHNYDRGIVEIVRTDTYAIVDWRSMSHEERQQKLPFKPIEEAPAIPKTASSSDENVKTFFKQQDTKEQAPTIPTNAIAIDVRPHGDVILTCQGESKIIWSEDLKSVLTHFKVKEFKDLNSDQIDTIWNDWAVDYEPVDEEPADIVEPIKAKSNNSKENKRKSKPVVTAVASGD
jgi:hypothetical protein